MSGASKRYLGLQPMPWVLGALLCLILAGGAARAQPAAGLSGEEQRRVSFRVYLWSRDSDVSGYLDESEGGTGYTYVAPRIAYRKNPAGEMERIHAVDGQVSPEYTFVGEGPLVFYREGDGVDGAAVRVPLASVDAARMEDDMLLIFFPIKRGTELGYRILPIATPQQRISEGQAMFYNLTRQKLMLYTGAKPEALAPGEVVLSEIRPEAGTAVPVRILAEDRGEWVMRYAQRQTIGASEKLIYFIFPQSPESKRLRVLSVDAAG